MNMPAAPFDGMAAAINKILATTEQNDEFDLVITVGNPGTVVYDKSLSLSGDVVQKLADEFENSANYDYSFGNYTNFGKIVAPLRVFSYPHSDLKPLVSGSVTGPVTITSTGANYTGNPSFDCPVNRDIYLLFSASTANPGSYTPYLVRDGQKYPPKGMITYNGLIGIIKKIYYFGDLPAGSYTVGRIQNSNYPHSWMIVHPNDVVVYTTSPL